MSTVLIFKRLGLVDISRVGTNWGATPMKKMVEFVEACNKTAGNFTSAEESYWAAHLYVTLSEHSLRRMRRFSLLVQSIYRGGYLTVLDSPDEFGVLHPPFSYAWLPRFVEEGNLLDDGRHRVAVLKALGVCETPAIIIELRNGSLEESLDSHTVLNHRVQKALPEFAASEEWLKYTYTECYRKSRRWK